MPRKTPQIASVGSPQILQEQKDSLENSQTRSDNNSRENLERTSKEDPNSDSFETINLGKIILRHNAKETLLFENVSNQENKSRMDCTFERLLVEPEPNIFERYKNVYKVYIEVGLRLTNGKPFCMSVPLGEPIWSNDPRCKAFVEFNFTPIKKGDFVNYRFYELTGESLNTFLKEIQFCPETDQKLGADVVRKNVDQSSENTAIVVGRVVSPQPQQSGLNFAQDLHNERSKADDGEAVSASVVVKQSPSKPGATKAAV